FLALAVMRRVVEPGRDAALGVRAARRVATELERKGPRRIGGEGHGDQVHHDVDVLLERIGHANRRVWERARLAAAVARLDALDAALDLADVLQVFVEPLTIARANLFAQLRDLRRHPVENALVRAETRGALLCRRADAEQLVEHDPRIAHHR